MFDMMLGNKTTKEFMQELEEFLEFKSLLASVIDERKQKSEELISKVVTANKKPKKKRKFSAIAYLSKQKSNK